MTPAANLQELEDLLLRFGREELEAERVLKYLQSQIRQQATTRRRMPQQSSMSAYTTRLSDFGNASIGWKRCFTVSAVGYGSEHCGQHHGACHVRSEVSFT